jgi:hypothetical protein
MESLQKEPKKKDAIEEYMDKLCEKCMKSLPEVKKPFKITDDNIVIPTIKNYENITKYNYNLVQLKIIAKEYKLKISGNKPQLVTRIFSFLKLSSYIIKIQKNFRRFLVVKYKKLHGPACINRKICTNTTDFVTMEPLEEIRFYQFLSYKDNDGFIYGFDIVSLHNLYLKANNYNNICNPYNRNIFPEFIIKSIRSIIRLNKIFKIKIQMNYEDDSQNVSFEKAIEFRALHLFQSIDALGNYSNYNWFLSLNRHQLIKFVRELIDIWSYRAQLSNEVKRNICPPNGDPFRNVNIHYLHNEENISYVKKSILELMEKLVNSGINQDSKALGAAYVLGALTLVNSDAATCLPWLYQSFEHF